MPIDSLEEEACGELSEAIRSRVMDAREFRAARLGAAPAAAGSVVRPALGASCHRRAGTALVELRGDLTRDARILLRQAHIRESLSGRAHARVIELARTIADLDNLQAVGAEHVAEALSLRLDYRRLALC
ncbi:MAG: hypothetical protein M1274_05575 [Actinobacteria bacterium]|nr:hypothetical protein [Actinomycetota bacterium]